MHCSTISSLDSRTKPFTCFIEWITCPPIFKSPNPSRASLLGYLLEKLKKNGNKEHPCLTPLPILPLLVCPWSSFSWTHWTMYNLLINVFHASQYQFPLGSALIWSSCHVQMPSVSLWNKHTIPHLCPTFALTLFSAMQLHPQFLSFF